MYRCIRLYDVRWWSALTDGVAIVQTCHEQGPQSKVETALYTLILLPLAESLNAR